MEILYSEIIIAAVETSQGINAFKIYIIINKEFNERSCRETQELNIVE